MRAGLLVVIGLGLVACTTAGEVAPTTTTAPPITDEGPAGRLATIDDTGNVVVVDPDGSNRASLTDDGGVSARYTQPTWSPDSRQLAWSEVSEAGGPGLTMTDPDGGGRVTVPTRQAPFYISWSPDGRGIGLLHNGTSGVIEFELLDVAEGVSRVVADGAPFYFSWSPASDEVVVHVEGSTFSTLDLDGRATDLGLTGDGYAAPHWTEAGIFHLSQLGLELRDPSGEPSLLALSSGPLALSASPDGTRLAVQALRPDGPEGVGVALTEPAPLPTGSVVVVDVATQGVVTATERLSFGFFWSPDGRSLLVLEPTDDLSALRVLVWSDAGTTELGRIAPHPAFLRDVLQFFDQYAQSLRLWSPNSSAVAVPGAVDGERGVWVFPVDGSDPTRVADGSWAAWSPS
jgi:TolB protein